MTYASIIELANDILRTFDDGLGLETNVMDLARKISSAFGSYDEINRDEAMALAAEALSAEPKTNTCIHEVDDD
jgi:hypothetical protein